MRPIRPFSGFYSHEASLRRLARRLVHDENDIDDLVQQTWLRWIQSRPSEDRPLLPWLATVLRRELLLVRRAARRRRDRELLAGACEPASEAHRDPASADDRCALLAAVERLREPYRTVVSGRFLDERSPAALARDLGVPLETVRTRLRRGIAQLRDDLCVEGEAARGSRPRRTVLMFGLRPRAPRPARGAWPAVPAVASICFLAWMTVAVAFPNGDRPRGDVAGPSARAPERRHEDRIVGPLPPPRAPAPSGARVAADLAAARLVTLTGRTLIAGVPTGGVRVRAVRAAGPHVIEADDPPALAETVSAADGTYRLADVPSDAGLLATSATPRAFALFGRDQGGDVLSWRVGSPHRATRPLPVGGELDLALLSEYCLQVRVLDEDGAPLRDAGLLLKGTNHTLRRTRTDSNGEAGFGRLEAGCRVILGVGAPNGGYDVRGPLRLDGDLGPLEIRLGRPLTTSGTVLDANGDPAADEELRVVRVGEGGDVSGPSFSGILPSEWRVRGLPGAVRSDAAGRWSFDGLLAGAYEVAIVRRGGLRTVGFVSAGERDAVVRVGVGLQRSLVECVVRDALSGEPVLDATILAVAPGTSAVSTARRKRDGLLSLTLAPSGRKWLLLAQAPGYAQVRIEREFAPGAQRIEVALERATSVPLRLVDVDGAPVEGAWAAVVPRERDGDSRLEGTWAVSDGDGFVRLDEVPAGGALVAVYAPSLLRPFVVDSELLTRGDDAVLELPVPTAGPRRGVRLALSIPAELFVPRSIGGSAVLADPPPIRVTVRDELGRIAFDGGFPDTSPVPLGSQIGVRADGGRLLPTAPNLPLLWSVGGLSRRTAGGDVLTSPLALPPGALRLRVSCAGRVVESTVVVPIGGPHAGELAPLRLDFADAAPAPAERDRLEGARMRRR